MTKTTRDIDPLAAIKNMKLSELREELRLHRIRLPNDRRKWSQSSKNGEKFIKLEIEKRIAQKEANND